ncbi:alpha-glucosidase/alpha-galactosidase [Parvibaculum sp.]|uniref:alpha-glucosidase/alpha-galactosidase n=1 Tax=Parvibaculum sp. TaxID=2024848 RepID=UPI002731279B|nr:alpha-glucosidase/alpha-galactosidase [Parvibaculum sp.]MDP1628583.1 alpha-glucosidase/alpha-galactosidase [Parvibaculum sp.]MDP2150079.1 alpha-glucosidase/alpha-galactosidase [Parvibaculum sp.]MDP3330081.1 alpha-glucosidase/alpha-galactosidase [Parvibaculum sp.]
MTKVCMIGAGSTVFMKNLVGDILLNEMFADCEIALHDIDEARLKTSAIVAGKIADALSVSPAITATTDRREALTGADFVIVMIQVAGYKPGTVTDFEIPKKYGLRQTIADTLGVGGIMRGLRTVPVLLDIAKDMRELCPKALMLQYVNPMAINCWALNRLAPDIDHVGLCHSVQGTAYELSKDLDVDYKSLRYQCAGINHMAFYTKFEREREDGTREDLYPKLKEIAARDEEPGWNKVRYEILRRTGYFVTESSEHFAEYVPWFIKRDRPDLIEKFNIPLDEYIRRCEEQIAAWEAQERELVSANRLEVKFSGEYGAKIMRAVVSGKPTVINGNVANNGLIDNLPAGACVEVPCLVDANGVTPTRVGALPPHLAAMMQTNINVQSLTMEAIATGKREHIYHAAMMDPHTAAELSLDQIWALVDDLIEAHGDRLPAYR